MASPSQEEIIVNIQKPAVFLYAKDEKEKLRTYSHFLFNFLKLEYDHFTMLC